METAGKFVDDDELRAALKENGIGRPSSRAGIIETLFKRHYIRRERKNLVATPTGIELIDTIREELLKSCELTGIWEKKLRDIEHGTYDPAQFVAELKTQINDIVMDVLRDNSPRHFTIVDDRKPATTKGATAKGGAAKGDKAKEPAKKRAPRKTKAANAATQNSGNALSDTLPAGYYAAVSPDVDAINVECYIHSEDDLPEPEPEEDEEDDGTADSDEDDAQGVIDRILNTWTNAGSNP